MLWLNNTATQSDPGARARPYSRNRSTFTLLDLVSSRAYAPAFTVEVESEYPDQSKFLKLAQSLSVSLATETGWQTASLELTLTFTPKETSIMSQNPFLTDSFRIVCRYGRRLDGFASRGSATIVDGPNLSVRSDVLGSQWVVRDENIPAEACSAIEGEVTGLRKLVRFTVMTPNTGNRDIFVSDPNEHVAADDGLFELATCHNHYHFRHYALYELVDPRTGQVWRAAKRAASACSTRIRILYRWAVLRRPRKVS